MKREFALILPNPTTEEHEGKTVTIFENPTDANMVAKAIYGETAYAVESTMWDIREPFIYRDGAFYNVEEKAKENEKGEVEFVRIEEKLAERILTPTEEIQELKKQNQDLRSVVDTLLLESLGGV